MNRQNGLKFAGIAFGVLFVFSLANCGGDAPQIREKARGRAPAAKASSGVAKKDIQVPSPFSTKKDPYFYNPIGKRDPFKKYAGELVTDVWLPRSPLERYGLDELNLTAIVWGISTPRALLQAPDGYSYIVRTNMRVGKNRGRVSRVTKRKVFVEEEYRDPTGKLVVRESSFEIRPKEQKKRQSELQFTFKDE